MKSALVSGILIEIDRTTEEKTKRCVRYVGKRSRERTGMSTTFKLTTAQMMTLIDQHVIVRYVGKNMMPNIY